MPHAGLFLIYVLIITTSLHKLFEKLFIGNIRRWEKSNIVLLHLLSKFTNIERIYKINKNNHKFFNYFFDKLNEKNPLKDEIYELQKFVSDKTGIEFKEALLKYYHDNNFIDLSLIFIDGHVIAYFGKEAFQKLKHSTRNKIIKALEVFNLSDRKGHIFYFNVDHDVNGMRKNIEGLINNLDRIIGLKKVGFVIFDRGGFSGKLFKKLKERNIEFITLAVQNKNIKEQIEKIVKKTIFKKLKSNEKKEYAVSTLNIEKVNYRTLLIRNIESGEINPFITNIPIIKLSNEELLSSYSMHWHQEQEHNAVKKLGSDMHAKAMQDIEYDDITKIKQKKRLKNKLNKTTNEIIRLETEIKRGEGRLIYLTSKIRPNSKRTDNKNDREEIRYTKKRLKELKNKINELTSNQKQIEKKLKGMPDNPKKKRYKYGPVDYSLSIVNLASNLNSKIAEIFSGGENKYQLATLKNILYNISAQITETDTNLNIEYIKIRQKKNINGIQRLCDYFNVMEPKLNGKIIHFSIKPEE